MKNYNVIINKKIKPFNKIITVDSDKLIQLEIHWSNFTKYLYYKKYLKI